MRGAACPPGDLNPGNHRHVCTNEVGSVIEELLLAQRLAAERHLHDRYVRRAVTDDKRGCRPGWHHTDHGLGDRRNLRGRSLDVGTRLKEDFYD